MRSMRSEMAAHVTALDEKFSQRLDYINKRLEEALDVRGRLTMQAFVMKGIDRGSFADKLVPKAGPKDAIIKTTKALICTSDTHTVHN
jgi:hypothetical protein